MTAICGGKLPTAGKLCLLLVPLRLIFTRTRFHSRRIAGYFQVLTVLYLPPAWLVQKAYKVYRAKMIARV